ncbi:MAG: hypothetical protein IKI28_10720 [Bacteroidales bacterium]|nr:hypothetical protein [Bacteroidales bacterium]
MRKTICIAAIVLLPLSGLWAQADSSSTSANQSDFSADFSAELRNRRMWRGFVSSRVPELITSIDLSYKGLFAGAWSAYSFTSRPMQEVDVWIGYSIAGVTFTLIDYWYPSDTSGWRSDLFNFNPKTTIHQAEAILQYDFRRIPLSLTGAVMIFGDDRDTDGNNLYSSYFEAAYQFDCKGVGIRPFIGVSPTRNGMYCESFNVVNLGTTFSKQLPIGRNYSMPATCSLVINPYQETIGVIFTLGII